jgi:hypothetical protein
MTKRTLVRRLAVVVALAGAMVGFGATDAHAANIVAANNFSNAPLLPPGNGGYTGNNASATRQVGEPDHGPSGAGGGATVWYRYRRATAADIRLTLQGSNFDTVLAVYRGNSLNNLVEVESNDDTDTNEDALWSLLEFRAQANVTYRIVIDGYNSTDDAADRFDTRRGRYSLHVTRLT